MIGYLRGRVRDKGAASLVVDVGGIGWDVQADRQTLADIGPEGTETALFVRTVVREDAITLFGFASVAARDVFDLLCGVAGVGPKLASQILGGLPLPDLVQAVRAKDLRRLVSIPGVGKKTAERLALELSDKFLLLPIDAPAPAAGIPDRLAADVRSALANLGFGPRDIESALRALKPAAGFEDLLRQAIAHLSAK